MTLSYINLMNLTVLEVKVARGNSSPGDKEAAENKKE